MKTDVAIIGAGPAGSTAAKYLAENGISVILIDKATFPRDKSCGGGLPLKVIRRFPYITEKDIIESYTYGGFLYSSSLIYKAYEERKEPVIAMVSRKTFDQGLVDFACESGAQFINGNGANTILITPDCVHITLDDGTEIKAKVIIGADGFSGCAAKQTGLCSRYEYFGICVFDEYPLSETAVKQYFSEKRLLHVFLKYQGMQGYAWVFPKKKSVNIGLGEIRSLTDPSILKTNLKTSYASFFSMLKQQHIIPKHLKINKLHGGSMPLFPLEKTYSDRVILCGDAAGFINPITGEGVYYAMISGSIAAQVITQALEADDLSSVFLSKYQKLWKNTFGKDLTAILKTSKGAQKNTDIFIKRIGSNKHLSSLCFDIMTGEKTIDTCRGQFIIHYVLESLKDILTTIGK